MPPLQPGLPVLWCPTVVVYALAQQLRRCGLVARVTGALLDELVAPWGLKRHRGTAFRVPCDCGRLVRHLELGPRGWSCSRCGVSRTRLEIVAARLLFGFRLGLRGRYLTSLHTATVRRLLGQLPRDLGFRRFAVVQAATVVVSMDPHTWEARRGEPGSGAWRPLGPVGQALGGRVLDVWCEEWANPAAYRARCLAELQL